MHEVSSKEHIIQRLQVRAAMRATNWISGSIESVGPGEMHASYQML